MRPATLTRRRAAGVVAASLAILLVLVVAAVLFNPNAWRPAASAELPFRAALAALLGQGDDPIARVIVWHARVPRVLLAALVGAALGQSGAMLQAMLRNPLADPYVLGVSSGAALAAVLVSSLGLSLLGAGHPLAAAAGALGAALLVQRLARDEEGRLGGERLVLAGVVLSYLLAAGVMWVVSLASAEQGQRYLFWLMGSLAGASMRDVSVLAVAVGAGLAGAVAVVPALNLMMLSEEHAADCGVSVDRTKHLTFALTALLTGSAVAVAGSIGFVGLVVPHSVRLLAGTDMRVTTPLAAVAGAGFLVLADAASRALGEVPVGVVTASFGAPFFLWLLTRRRAQSRGTGA